MAWDFSTEPEFQEQLDWMRQFVREEIWPLETIVDELDQEQLDRVYAPLQEEVKRARAVGRAPRSRARRPGLRPGQARADARDPRHLARTRRTRSATRRRTRATARSSRWPGTPEQKERWLDPLLAGDLKSAFSMTEPDVAGSDPTTLQTRAVREGDEYVINGHKWFSTNASIADFLIVMAVTDPDARPHQRASMIIVPADTPGVNIVRDVATMEHPIEGRSASSAATPRSSTRTCACPADSLLGDEGEGFLIAQHRLVPGPHPPLHALARRLAAARSTCSASARSTARRAARRWPRSRRSRTGSPTPPPRCRPRG